MSDPFVTPWTAARQAPLSMGFARQEYWSGMPFPSPGDLPDLGIGLVSPALAGRLSGEPLGKSLYWGIYVWDSACVIRHFWLFYQEQPHGKGAQGKVVGAGVAGSFHVISTHDSFLAHWCVCQVRSLWIPSFRAFHSVFLCRPLEKDSISSTSFLSGGWELGWKFFLVTWWPNPYPEASQGPGNSCLITT